MEQTIRRDGKLLRLGYTTGSCAAAAAKAAAWMLLTGRRREQISLMTPKGIGLQLRVEQITMTPDAVTCAIRKDSGDDPDITDGTLIFATVRRSDSPGISIDGGPGIGRVTKPGLDQSVGSAAINSVPRQMIRENVLEICRLTDEHGGLSVQISAPEGETLAKKTFNPRLGIVGGISILGTTGIVEPMSEQALVDTIRVELRQRRAEGQQTALLTPGNYGFDFLRQALHLDGSKAVLVSNFIGDAIDLCRELGFRRILLVGHIGKLVKLAGNMMNTHSKYGDCRMELLAAYAGACGLPPEKITELLQCVACDEALRILKETNCCAGTMELLTARIEENLRHRAGEDCAVGAILFSREYGLLGETSRAAQLLQTVLEE